MRFDAWADDFGVEGVVSGLSILEISGGQLANLFGTLNPDIDLRNPIRLFTFEVTAADELFAEYVIVPNNPNPSGPLSFYPDHMDGDWITMLPRFVGWEGTVVPGPGTAVVFSAVCWPWLLRRRGVRRPGGVDSKRRPRCD